MLYFWSSNSVKVVISWESETFFNIREQTLQFKVLNLLSEVTVNNPPLVTMQGLFHPARKVRDVYWKIYNSIYIGSQDALIAHYPQVYNDEKNMYVRYELDYVL